MFNGAVAFNQPLNSWSTIAVTNMSSMFKSATLFNQPLNLWSTGSVTNMSEMFNGALAFNQNIINWNVSNVTNSTKFSLGSLIETNAAFNPLLTTYTGTFQYTFTYTGVSGATNIWTQVPIANTNNSFGTISGTITPSNLPANGAFVTVTIPFRYVDTGSTKDGLGFHPWAAGQLNFPQFYTYSTTGLTITQFGGIPLYRNSGRQFAALSITFPNDAPTILSNTSLNSCFIFSGHVFNNSLNNWDVSNAVNMGAMFYSNATMTFNEPLNNWNTSKVTTMAGMFGNIKGFNQNISTWNTSAVTSTSGMFSGAVAFNQSLSSWNFGLVTDMSGMFEGAIVFNNGGVPLTWNTANVTAMNRMFINAIAFNGGGAALTWNTSKVTNFASMFAGASNFNQRLDFNTSSANTMFGMFTGALKFNNGDAAGISNTPLVFNTSLVTNMSGMFSAGASLMAFNQSLASFDTSNVTTMGTMFARAASFNKLINFNTAKVTDFGSMFYLASAFNNGDLPGVSNTPLILNTSSALSISAMFYSATSFNQSVSNFNTSNVSIMSYVFWGATRFNMPLNSWDTSKVTDISFMFNGASLFNQPLSSWNTSNVTTMSNAFNGATNFDMPLNSWVTSKVTNISFMFNGASVFNRPLNSWDTSKVTTMTSAFQLATAFIQNISNWNTTLVTSSTNFSASCPINNTAFSPIAFQVPPLNQFLPFTYTFTYTGTDPNVNFVEHVPIINADSSYDISNVSFVNNSNVITVSCVPIFTDNGTTNDGISFANVVNFYNTQTTGLTITRFAFMQMSRGGNQFMGLTRLAITATDSPKMMNNTSFANCFKDCVNFNNSIWFWDVRRVTNLSQAFMGAIVYNSEIFGWNTGAVTNMSGTFNNARAFRQQVNSWNVSGVTDMSNMFKDTHNYNQALTLWNTSAVTNMSGMFNGARSFDLSINSFNTSAVTNMADMFNGAILFNAPLNSWNTSAVTNMNSMFNGASRFEQNIRGWVVSNVTDSTNFSTGSLINGTIFSPFTSAVTGVPGSIYLRGSGQHLVGATNTSLMLSGNFTIEFYLRNGPQVGENYIFGANSSNNSGGYTILANNVNGGAFAATDKILVYKPGVGGGLIKGTTTLSTRTWIHVAIVRNGTSANNVKLYVNGVFEQQSSDNNVWDYATNGFIVGAYFGGSATYNYVGRLSNFRIVNGTAVYTSNFTPPTTTLTSIPGTSLLLNTRFGNSLTDSSPNNITVTAMNNPVFDVLSPVSS
jgi:surface protein